MIDNNEKEKKVIELFKQKKEKEARELQDEFLADVKAWGGDYCSCKVKDCKFHGKCVECVQIHRGHNHHLPHCIKGWVKRKSTDV